MQAAAAICAALSIAPRRPSTPPPGFYDHKNNQRIIHRLSRSKSEAYR